VSYCEYPEFYDETFPRAAKEHVCCECKIPIKPREGHLHWRAKWDGDFASGRQHLVCRELCMKLRSNEQIEDCVPFGYLFEEWGNIFWTRKDRGRVERRLMAQIKWRIRRTKRQSVKLKGGT